MGRLLSGILPGLGVSANGQYLLVHYNECLETCRVAVITVHLLISSEDRGL